MHNPPVRNTPFLNLKPLVKSFREIGRAAARFTVSYPLAGFLLGIFILTGAVYQSANHAVSVYIDGETVLVTRTFNRTVEEVLAELDIQLDPHDRVTPGPAAVITRQARIDIDRAFPVVVIADGSISLLWTPVTTVGQFLEDRGFQPGPYDHVEPDRLEQLEYMSEISITRVTRLYAGEQGLVSRAEAAGGNPLMYRGFSRLPREGTGVLQELIYEVTLENGLDVDRRVINSCATVEPPVSIVDLAENTRVKHEGLVMTFERVLAVTATAYCPGTPGSGCPLINEQGHSFCTHMYNDGFTYTGKRTIQGEGTLGSPRIVAVDPKVIPLGSLLYIEDIPGVGRIGFARAEDVGGAIKGNRIDLLFDMHSDTVQFGIRRGVKVYVLAQY